VQLALPMALLTNSFKLQNADPRWYRDKYLTIIAFVCLIAGLSLLWNWPPPHSDLVRGSKFLIVAVACVVISSQRYLVLVGVLGIILFRGTVVAVLHQSLTALGVAVVAGIAAYFLLRGASEQIAPSYKVNDYSYAELLIDVGVLGIILLLYSRFS
jgi:hypothetical protein